MAQDFRGPDDPGCRLPFWKIHNVQQNALKIIYCVTKSNATSQWHMHVCTGQLDNIRSYTLGHLDDIRSDANGQQICWLYRIVCCALMYFHPSTQTTNVTLSLHLLSWDTPGSTPPRGPTIPTGEPAEAQYALHAIFLNHPRCAFSTILVTRMVGAPTRITILKDLAGIQTSDRCISIRQVHIRASDRYTSKIIDDRC